MKKIIIISLTLCCMPNAAKPNPQIYPICPTMAYDVGISITSMLLGGITGGIACGCLGYHLGKTIAHKNVDLHNDSNYLTNDLPNDYYFKPMKARKKPSSKVTFAKVTGALIGVGIGCVLGGICGLYVGTAIFSF